MAFLGPDFQRRIFGVGLQGEVQFRQFLLAQIFVAFIQDLRFVVGEFVHPHGALRFDDQRAVAHADRRCVWRQFRPDNFFPMLPDLRLFQPSPEFGGGLKLF